MPIRPENKARYPDDWRDIATKIKDDADWTCQGSPAYPDCRAVHGDMHPDTGSVVVLTVAHLDHQPENCEPENLRAWCQRCHLRYDMPRKIAERRQRNAQSRAIGDFFRDDN